MDRVPRTRGILPNWWVLKLGDAQGIWSRKKLPVSYFPLFKWSNRTQSTIESRIITNVDGRKNRRDIDSAIDGLMTVNARGMVTGRVTIEVED